MSVLGSVLDVSCALPGFVEMKSPSPEDLHLELGNSRSGIGTFTSALLIVRACSDYTTIENHKTRASAWL